MSGEQLLALLSTLREDTELQDTLKGTAELEAFMAIVQEAGRDYNSAVANLYRSSSQCPGGDCPCSINASPS